MAKKHSRSTVIAADKSTAGSQYTGTQTRTDTDTQTQRNTDTRTAITNRNVKPDDSDHLLRSTPLHRVPSWPAPSESLPRKFRQTFRNCPTVVSAFTFRIYLRVTLRCLLLPHFRRFRCHTSASELSVGQIRNAFGSAWLHSGTTAVWQFASVPDGVLMSCFRIQADLFTLSIEPALRPAFPTMTLANKTSNGMCNRLSSF